MEWQNYSFGRNVGEDVARWAEHTRTVTTQFLASQKWTDITISKSVFRHMTLRGMVDIFRRFGKGYLHT